MSNTSRYIVISQPIHVPGALRATAGQRVALVEVEPGYRGTPQTISVRTPGVRRIAGEWNGTGIEPALAANRLKARLEGVITL